MRTILAHEKLNTALGAGFVTLCVLLTVWLAVALVVGSVVLVRAIDGSVR